MQRNRKVVISASLLPTVAGSCVLARSTWAWSQQSLEVLTLRCPQGRGSVPVSMVPAVPGGPHAQVSPGQSCAIQPWAGAGESILQISGSLLAGGSPSAKHAQYQRPDWSLWCQHNCSDDVSSVGQEENVSSQQARQENSFSSGQATSCFR